ncbi:MAG TPA: cytochrome c-type biogenesis protein [Burkholderiaceae bacterium]|nr:cytochrome c-type biogenesis protein [Burkholderiaceae bacterium]
MRSACVASLLALALCGSARAADADSTLDAQVQRIAAELRCLVCQNQTLADSNADLALDLRAQMRTMLRDGADDDAVRRYMTERYGDFVLYRPPLKGTTLALWFGPLLLLAGGLATLFIVLRRRSRLGAEHFDADADEIEADEGAVP